MIFFHLPSAAAASPRRRLSPAALTRLRKPVWGLVLALILPASASAQGVDRLALERVYRSWVGAMNTGNFTEWKRVTATHRQVRTQNLVVSRKGKWPQSIFRLPFRLPEIATLAHLATLRNGDTAHLIYFGQIDFGLAGGTVPDNVILLKFVREDGAWKYDNTRYFNLAEEPEVRRMAELGDTEFLDDPQFQPTGEVPEIPRRIAPPDYVGDLWIASLGYETTIRIGDLHETVVANQEVTAAVIGGLSRSGLPITVSAREIDFPAGAKRHLAVEVYALRPGKKAVRVWQYKPDLETDDLSMHRSKVWANAVTIPGG